METPPPVAVERSHHPDGRRLLRVGCALGPWLTPDEAEAFATDLIESAKWAKSSDGEEPTR